MYVPSTHKLCICPKISRMAPVKFPHNLHLHSGLSQDSQHNSYCDLLSVYYTSTSSISILSKPVWLQRWHASIDTVTRSHCFQTKFSKETNGFPCIPRKTNTCQRQPYCAQSGLQTSSYADMSTTHMNSLQECSTGILSFVSAKPWTRHCVRLKRVVLTQWEPKW